MLALKNRHERDANLDFTESTHTYIYQKRQKFTSVTTVIHAFFEKFDADKIIAKMMNSENWINSPYFGKSVAEIKADWEVNRDTAATMGTKMHKQIEDFFNGQEIEKPLSKEFNQFYDFWQNFTIDNPDWIPWRTEWIIYNEDINLAGSIDFLIKNPKTNEYVILDWKRSKEIKMDNRFQKGIGPFEGIPDCNYQHYCIQLNCYRKILETKYNINVKAMFLLVCHPNKTEAEYIQVPKNDAVISALWQYLPFK